MAPRHVSVQSHHGHCGLLISLSHELSRDLGHHRLALCIGVLFGAPLHRLLWLVGDQSRRRKVCLVLAFVELSCLCLCWIRYNWHPRYVIDLIYSTHLCCWRPPGPHFCLAVLFLPCRPSLTQIFTCSPTISWHLRKYLASHPCLGSSHHSRSATRLLFHPQLQRSLHLLNAFVYPPSTTIWQPMQQRNCLYLPNVSLSSLSSSRIASSGSRPCLSRLSLISNV